MIPASTAMLLSLLVGPPEPMTFQEARRLAVSTRTVTSVSASCLELDGQPFGRRFFLFLIRDRCSQGSGGGVRAHLYIDRWSGIVRPMLEAPPIEEKAVDLARRQILRDRKVPFGDREANRGR